MKQLIDRYRLSPHPEGGFFREIHRSGDAVWSNRVSGRRAAVTHIYFLLPQGHLSRFHRVAHEEIWHVYDGAPLRIILEKSDHGFTDIRIGPGCADPVRVIPAGAWQAAESTGAYTLCGCTVAPGFEFTDFCFLSDHPDELTRCRDLPGFDARFT